MECVVFSEQQLHLQLPQILCWGGNRGVFFFSLCRVSSSLFNLKHPRPSSLSRLDIKSLIKTGEEKKEDRKPILSWPILSQNLISPSFQSSRGKFSGFITQMVPKNTEGFLVPFLQEEFCLILLKTNPQTNPHLFWSHNLTQEKLVFSLRVRPRDGGKKRLVSCSFFPESK